MASHECLVGDPGKKSGRAAVEHAEQHENYRRADADEQGYPCTMHESREHVAAEIVGSERVQAQGYGIAHRQVVGTCG
jgi:hypothetical protein